MIIPLKYLNEKQVVRYDLLVSQLTAEILDKSIPSDIPKVFTSVDYGAQTDRLLLCAKHTALLYSKHTDIPENFQYILSEITPYIDPTILDIMVPVLFFAAILKNEYNHSTVKKRLYRGNTNWGDTKDLLTDVLPQPNVNRYQKNKFQTMCSELAAKYAHHFDAENDSGFISSSLQFHASQALQLTGCYDAILLMQEIAKIGLFALRILKSEHSAKTPMVTLIRMSVIEKICSLLTSCEDLCNSFPIFKSSFGGLVTRYYFNGDPLMERRLSNAEFEWIRQAKEVDCVDVSKVLAILETDEEFEKVKNTTFNIQYDQLFHWMSLSNTEINAMLDYYLDEAELIWYANFTSHVTEYLRDILLALDNKIRFDASKYASIDKFLSFLNRF